MTIPYAKLHVSEVQFVYSVSVGTNFMDTGSEKRLKRSDGRNPQRNFWTARAVSLIAVVTFVQVAHVHPATSDTDNCPICVVMHSAAPVAVVAAAIVFVTASSPVPVPVVHSVVRPWHCTLFNRPPPKQA
jgi:hypothetical protein